MSEETTDLDRTSAEMVGQVDDPEMARRIAAFFETIVAAAAEGRLEYLGILVGVRQPSDEEKLDIYARAVYGDDFLASTLGETIAAGHAELGRSAETYDPEAPDPERILQ